MDFCTSWPSSSSQSSKSEPQPSISSKHNHSNKKEHYQMTKQKSRLQLASCAHSLLVKLLWYEWKLQPSYYFVSPPVETITFQSTNFWSVIVLQLLSSPTPFTWAMNYQAWWKSITELENKHFSQNNVQGVLWMSLFKIKENSLNFTLLWGNMLSRHVHFSMPA